MRKKKVLHLPDWRSNPYQLFLINGILKYGWVGQLEDYPKGLLPLLQCLWRDRTIDAFHLHWPDPYFQRFMWAKNNFIFFAKSLLIYFEILLIRASGRPVIWTVHNELSHETRDELRERYLSRILARSVTRLLFHSQGARDRFCDSLKMDIFKKSSIVVHGNYIGWYKTSNQAESELRRKYQITEKNTVYLVFGGIRRYKGIPKVISAFQNCTNKEARLIIAGSSFDEVLDSEIRTLASADSRIHVDIRFITDQEVAPLLSICDAALFGFERTLTSGSVILAMSYAAGTILNEQSRLIDVANDSGSVFFTDSQSLSSFLSNVSKERLRESGRRWCIKMSSTDRSRLSGHLTR